MRIAHSVFGALAHNDPRFRFSLAVSPGSELVTTAADYLDYALSRPATRVVGCVVHLSSTTPEPGHVRHVNGNGLIIGKPAGGASPGVQALAATLEQAGFAVTVGIVSEAHMAVSRFVGDQH